MKTKIALIIDNPKRDLRGMLLLTTHLVRKGAEVVLVPMYTQEFDIAQLKPDVVVANYIRDGNAEILKRYKAMGARICVLDTEGGLISKEGPRSPRAWGQYLKRSGYGAIVDKYFFWGSSLADGFLDQGALRADQVIISGHPKFDITFPKWRGLLNSPRNNFVLFNSNFAILQPRFGRTSADEFQRCLESGFDRDFARQLFDSTQAVFDEFMKLLVHSARNFPQIQFVLRPHPFEDPSVYEKLKSTYSNIDVRCDNDIFDELMGARALFQCNCSTAIDSLFLDKPSYSLDFINHDFLYKYAPTPTDASRRLKSFEEFEEVLKRIQDQKSQIDYRLPNHDFWQRDVAPYFGERDGKNCQRMTDGLVALKRHKTEDLLSARSWKARELVKLALMTGLGTKKYLNLRAFINNKQKEKRFDSETVQNVLFQIDQLWGDKLSTQVKHGRHSLSGQDLASVVVYAEEK